MDGSILKNIKYLIIPVLLLAIGIMAFVAFRQKDRRLYTGLSSGRTVEVSDVAEIYGADGRLYAVTSNGVKGYDGDGGLTLDMAFELDHPFLSARGKACAVADIGGKKVYVVSADGMPYSYETEYPIVKMCAADDGTTAVLLNNDTRDLIRIYTPKGELKIEIGTKTSVDGFPVDIALSADGKKLVTLYLSFEGDEMASKVTFYNTGDIGKNFIENIVGQKIYANEMAYSVKFMGSGHIATVFGNGFSLFAMDEIPGLVTDMRTEDRLSGIEVCDECIALLSEKDGNTKLDIYNTSGGLSASIAGLGDCEGLTVAEGEILLMKPQNMIIYRMNGSLKLNCYYDGGSGRIYPGGGNKYLIAEPGRIRAVALLK